MEEQLHATTACLSTLKLTPLAHVVEDVVDAFVDGPNDFDDSNITIDQVLANFIALEWVIDYGTNIHLTRDKNSLSGFVPVTTSTQISTADSSALDRCQGEGHP